MVLPFGWITREAEETPGPSCGRTVKLRGRSGPPRDPLARLHSWGRKETQGPWAARDRRETRQAPGVGNGTWGGIHPTSEKNSSKVLSAASCPASATQNSHAWNRGLLGSPGCLTASALQSGCRALSWAALAKTLAGNNKLWLQGSWWAQPLHTGLVHPRLEACPDLKVTPGREAQGPGNRCVPSSKCQTPFPSGPSTAPETQLSGLAGHSPLRSFPALSRHITLVFPTS